MSDILRERVAKLFCTAAEGRRWGCGEPKCWCYIQADIARALIRAEVLEEVANPAFLRPLVEEQAKGEWDDYTIDEDVAMFVATIRALKEKP